MDDVDHLQLKILDKIHFGDCLMQKLKMIQDIDGVMKLQRKIRQEIDFLTKLHKAKNAKAEQLCCTNLTHLGALVDCALRPDVIAVYKNFHINETNKLVVDIVSNEGRIWSKVIARNPKSLSALSHGNSSFGARSILDQAKDYIECANMHQCMYRPPQVVFEFVNGIEHALAAKLQNIGVIVKGEILPNSVNPDILEETSDSDTSDDISADARKNIELRNCNGIKDESEIDTLNLDVTTMMAFVSNMTNGYCKFVFEQGVLTQQASWESMRPVKPTLDKLFYGKKLVCCQTAWDEFEKILHILGGPMEKQRASHLKQLLTILPDNTGGPDDEMRKGLKVRGHVRTRSKIIFNFGHRIKALTVSANEGFVRAAHQQGIMYATFIHESRALSEGKENTAVETS